MSRKTGGPSRRPRNVDQARIVAFEALRAITTDGAYANLVLAELLSRKTLSARDAAFATELVFGTSRWLGSYDRIIELAAGRSLTSFQPALLDVLRLGVHQLLAMRVPVHAGVDASVNLAALRIGERVAGITNAVIRKVAARDLDGWFAELTNGLDETDALSIREGHPRWIVDAYAEVLPPEELPNALSANNIAAVPTLVVRPGLADRAELLDAQATSTKVSPWGVRRSGNPAELKAIVEGRAGVQDEGSQLVCLALSRVPKIAGRWLDLCAGPGGKSALLRGLASSTSSFLVSADAHLHRAELVSKALRTYPACGHQVINADALHPAWSMGTFSLVLADVPCSGLGALRRRPESRWRRGPEIIDELAELQRAILHTAIASAAPGGVVAYVTCSPHVGETVSIVQAAIRTHEVEVLNAPALLPEVSNAASSADRRFVQLWPHRHGTDAMFLAVLRVGS